MLQYFGHHDDVEFMIRKRHGLTKTYLCSISQGILLTQTVDGAFTGVQTAYHRFLLYQNFLQPTMGNADVKYTHAGSNLFSKKLVTRAGVDEDVPFVIVLEKIPDFRLIHLNVLY